MDDFQSVERVPNFLILLATVSVGKRKIITNRIRRIHIFIDYFIGQLRKMK